MIKDYTKNMENPTMAGLKEGLLWGGAVYGVGYLAQKLKDKAKDNNPYRINYPLYEEEGNYY